MKKYLKLGGTKPRADARKILEQYNEKIFEIGWN